ncbi:MAG: alpha/beta hydrolase-fold protein, partial [Acidobacteriota bacterium]|nr:alpha/beta hydrolase-fold protein [Acidobacteriota bacterium]
ELPFRKKTYTDKQRAKMPYRLFVPPSYQPGAKFPLILWFHGGSGRGSNNESQISNENEKGAQVWTTPANQAMFPAFVLAPQCAVGENWSDPDVNEIAVSLRQVLAILAAVEKEYSIDADRIYLVGQSMGGLGVWALLQAYPAQWAGAIVVSCYDNFTNAKGISRVPLWIFQGDADLTVPVDLVRQMVKQLQKSGGQPHYSEYHKAGHEIWERVFAEQQLVPWLASQKLSRPGATN